MLVATINSLIEASEPKIENFQDFVYEINWSGIFNHLKTIEYKAVGRFTVGRRWKIFGGEFVYSVYEEQNKGLLDGELVNRRRGYEIHTKNYKVTKVYTKNCNLVFLDCFELLGGQKRYI